MLWLITAEFLLLILVGCAIWIIMNQAALDAKIAELNTAVNALIARIPAAQPPIDFTPEVNSIQAVIDAANAAVPTP